MALLAIYLASNILIFEKKSNRKEMDDIVWRLFPTEQQDLSTTSLPVSTTEQPPAKDKCEPLYVLVYAHCCVWFLFLVSLSYLTVLIYYTELMYLCLLFS